MSWKDSIIQGLGGITEAGLVGALASQSVRSRQAMEESIAKVRTEIESRVKESMAGFPWMAGHDPDDWKFRRFSQLQTRDILPVAQDRMVDIAAYLYVVNPLAGSLVEVTRDFVVGKGFTAASQNPDVDRVIKRFWEDGSNRMDLKLPEKVLQLGLFGEQCYPAFVSDNYGLVRLGYVDPAMIRDVWPDPDNVEQLVAVVTRDYAGRPGKKFKIILNEDEEQIVSDKGRQLRDECTDGDCFYFSVNRLSNMTRGKSDLMRLLDWLDAYEEFLFENLERITKHLDTFIWDVTFSGLTEEEISKRMAAMRPPRRGSVRAHNENVKWDAVAPDLKSAEVHISGQTYKRHIIGTGARMPLTWFGDPEDSNKASASEMTDPPVVKLSARQLYVITCVEEILRYQLLQARIHGTLGQDEVELFDSKGQSTGKVVPLKTSFSVTAPEISMKDTGRLATSMLSIATSLSMAEQQGWLSKEKAAEIYASVAQQLGPEIDVAREVQDERVTADYVDQAKIRRLRDVVKRG